MITKVYNPSPLEVEVAEIIKDLKEEFNNRLKTNNIVEILVNEEKDNPDLLLKLKDDDGDKHEIVIRLIQRPDTLVS